MLSPRITPCLLLQDSGLVKTVGFKSPRYIGDPINAVKIFNEKQADELIVLDIDAATRRREPNFKLISQFAVECRMPLCYGGGVTTVDDAKRIISLGVEKVALSSAAIANPSLVRQIADEIGSQSVVVVLDHKLKSDGRQEVCTHNGTRFSGLSLVEAAQQAEGNGAGEIVMNSIDRDGAMNGYALADARSVRNAVNLPMTVLGGAGAHSHFSELFSACGVVGAAAGSFFVFKGPFRAVLISYPTRDQKDAIVRRGLEKCEIN